MVQEIETDLKREPDGKKITIVMVGEDKLSIEEVILELEYLINELAKADDAKKKPGAVEH